MHTFHSTHHSTVHVDLGAIEHNCNVIRGHIGDHCQLCAVVKADGYGLGAVRVASRIGKCADLLAVYSPDEAGELLAAGITTPILILAPVHSIDRFHPIYRGITSGLVHFVVHDMDHLHSLSLLGDRFGTQLNVQVKIDTGLHRGGCERAQSRELIDSIQQHARMNLTGVLTHFISAVDDEALTRLQHDRFDRIIQSLPTALPQTCVLHEANTAATIQWKWSHRSMVRVGLAWTGVVPDGVETLDGLRPVMSWRASLVHVRHVGAGEQVGYSGKWTARRDSLIGIVPVGYSSGFPMGIGSEVDRIGAFVRLFDEKFECVVGEAPIVGSICMDQIAVDLTEFPKTHIGCGIELISADRTSKASLEHIARVAGVVPHSIISRISPRVHRAYRTSVSEIHTNAAHQMKQCL